ncbi:pre-mRNA-splicing factor SLU7-like [Sorex araneus]|uniref:pre-mRNA-splicing factor SLU7-like n=1 Tax=Sorex araneus TaxID=42254 RepID=UPI002433A81E|nr:pre-mRNA-splicing factor SLU7-like [Sorex araneus]
MRTDPSTLLPACGKEHLQGNQSGSVTLDAFTNDRDSNQEESEAAPRSASKETSLEEPKKMTRKDLRKKKELEEQRKLGNAPAEVDEEGKDINPHIPQYISSVPWYIDPSKRPTLKHQRPQPEKQKPYSSSGEWYKRGVKENSMTTKYRKGACENCGAMTHQKKDCCERPRRVGAKFTGTNLAPDEHIQPQLMFDYDGKRDRWNGYDPEEHRKTVEEYAKVDLAKRTLKVQKLQEELGSGKLVQQADSPRHRWGEEEPDFQAGKNHNSEEEDEDQYADDIDMPGQNLDSKRWITVRNLRIREDIAKYLRNLDLNSAYYDPKTRAMRENPYSNAGKNLDEVSYAGDNFLRFTGDSVTMAQTQLFAWEASDQASEVHLQADPTKLELLYKSFKAKKEDFKEQKKVSILEKYGGQEHLDAPPAELLLGQTEDYVEYSRHGTVIHGQNRVVTCSRYEEDVKIHNHTHTWGSYWKDGRWGYKCCHSFLKYSYCTGEAGKEVAHSEEYIPNDATEELVKKPPTLMEIHLETLKEEKKKKTHRKSNSDSGDEGKKHKTLKKALNAMEARLLHVKETTQTHERKRPYNCIYETRAPTEEEMEGCRMKRQRPDDPMASFFGQ